MKMGNNKSSNKQPVAHHPSITEVQRLIDRQNAINNEKVIKALEKLPKFNLKTQDFGSFVDEFNNAQAVLNAKLEVKTAKRVFESLIENEERRLYGQIPEELKRNDDWDGYIKALFDVFHTQAEIRIARRVLTRMEQGSEESVRSFRNRIDNAAGFAYPQSKEERITPSMDAFIFGLRRSLRMKILDRVPENLNKAFELAEYEERFPRRSNLDDDDICLVNAITITEVDSDEINPIEEPMDEDFDTSNQEIVDVERAELEAAHATFTEKAKVTGVTPSPNFGSLLPDTKMRKVYAMKKLTNANASALEAVAEQYEKAPDQQEPSVPSSSQRFAELDMISSPIISTGIPYGERKVKTSDGSTVSIPNTIRLHRNAEIIIIGLFKRNLEDVQAHNNVLSEVSQAMTEMSHGADLSSKAGWALRLKRKRGVYSEKAKRFAEKLFQRGDVSGRKMDPAEVERLMKEEESIKPYERMNAQQNRPYIGTLFKEKKAAKEPKAPKRRKTQDKNEEDEDENEEMMLNEDDEEDYGDLSDEDEENIDDFGRERDDVIHDIIRESFNELFNENDDPIIDDDSLLVFRTMVKMCVSPRPFVPLHISRSFNANSLSDKHQRGKKD
ncbi:hypothetical protein PRIPAC_78710 [Pristionchus pacificus]|uniref:NAD(P)H-hydrate epimerase n=1 Tax=Pristionchus pacificus TaxID=54126 RepID=A0A2A6CQL6_PRIPA|nr:hypothetical protein PRIPAC_78710 [Pristionchus pacificus]|eukprot:PDM80331.1 hypothetical protein PRIPAC_32910 [Pristionchus pacificus]